MEISSFFRRKNLNSAHHERKDLVWKLYFTEWEKWIYFTKMVSFTERPLRSHQGVRRHPHLCFCFLQWRKDVSSLVLRIACASVYSASTRELDNGGLEEHGIWILTVSQDGGTKDLHSAWRDRTSPTASSYPLALVLSAEMSLMESVVALPRKSDCWTRKSTWLLGGWVLVTVVETFVHFQP